MPYFGWHSYKVYSLTLSPSSIGRKKNRFNKYHFPYFGYFKISLSEN